MPDQRKPRPVALHLEGSIRLCRADDLRKLEWFGAFTAHRRIIEETFAAQEQGRGIMLVCEINGFPIGQVWIKFAAQAPRTARLWALRVMEPFQKQGLGAGLVRAAEEVLEARGFETCEIGVEKDNAAACRLYERLGYRFARTLVETFAYVTPAGESREETADQWILSKRLRVPG